MTWEVDPVICDFASSQFFLPPLPRSCGCTYVLHFASMWTARGHSWAKVAIE